MASIVKTPAGYRAFIMVKGVRKSKSFGAKYKAIDWARKEEELIRAAHEEGCNQSAFGSEKTFLYRSNVLQSANKQDLSAVQLDFRVIEALLERAAEIGAKRAILALVTYNLQDAARQLGVSSKTLSKRIYEQKIRAIDGRITGAELMRYLKEI